MTLQYCIRMSSQARFLKTALLTTIGLFPAWYFMQATHEVGHLLAGWFSTKHKVTGFAIPLLGFSSTTMSVYPRPAWVVWAGFVTGVLIPLAVWILARLLRCQAEGALRYFAGFCLLANGAYLGLGWVERVGDLDELMLHGTPTWVFIIMGLAMALAGRWLWTLNTPSTRPPASDSASR